MTFGKYLNKTRTVKKASATMWLLKIIYSVGQVNFRLVFIRTKKDKTGLTLMVGSHPGYQTMSRHAKW